MPVLLINALEKFLLIDKHLPSNTNNRWRESIAWDDFPFAVLPVFRPKN
ncbi:hypothetical protein NOC27_2391 [Nitrosococcus oceani AFC27]|nr:hypothetical protein NOC27_2391 [Nitrosococcus oceani AFC27]